MLWLSVMPLVLLVTMLILRKVREMQIVTIRLVKMMQVEV